MNDPTGFESAPAHYAGEREAIDVIRDEMTDEQFVAFCYGAMRKYQLRDGKKPGSNDAEKARWFYEMMWHVRLPRYYRDPRWAQADYKPYVRRPVAPDLYLG